LSPLRAARATWALNAAVWTFRLPAISPPLLDHRRSLTGGPVFGVHYNVYRLLFSVEGDTVYLLAIRQSVQGPIED
ncbi:MAG TPA: hypothetical protein VG406_24020, partial [Isosphaeraceae bacterium]|nr:hypothetical protein [Isosphaeraceae bacterium]